MGERLHRELQRAPARRTPRRRDLLHAQRGQDHRGKLAAALQHRASAWIARLQAAGTRGLHPGIRAGGPATPTSNAARAGAATIIALTIKLDPSVGADQGSDLFSRCMQRMRIYEDDHQPSAWRSITGAKRTWDYAQVHLNDG